jgi:hypothetical protein
MKNLLSLIISAMLIVSFACPTLAADTIKKAPLKLTEEYIEEHGIRSVDEEGNEIIEIPLGPSNDIGKYIPASQENYDEQDIHHDLSESGSEKLRHFSPTIHYHDIVNLRSVRHSGVIPVTQFANQGFTISKSYSTEVSVSAALSLSGGIEKNAVSGELGFEVGGSYSRGYGEEYSTTVPNGYRGRIAYRYSSTLNYFDNKTTYIWQTAPYSSSTFYNACTAESEPTNGYFYLQLISY